MSATSTASALFRRAPAPQVDPPDTGAARWFYRPIRKERPAFRLYCFPYAGGSATTYRTWAPRAPDPLEVVGIELPGRGARIREAPIPDLDLIARQAADAILWSGDTRFAFFGHSMGAMLAFEVARRLRSMGAPQPGHLFLSACRAPHLTLGRPEVAAMSDEEFLSRLRGLNGTPPSVLEDPELMAIVLPVLKADFQAVDVWKPKLERPLTIPITALGGRSDPHVSRDAVGGWQQYTRGEFHLRTFDGDHFFLGPREPALVDVIVRTLRADAWI